MSSGQRYTTETYIQKAKNVHGNKYDYSKVIYAGSYSKITIICPEHGLFQQVPSNHLQGVGCRACGYQKNSKNGRKGLSYFIDKAKLIHGDKYDYSKVNFYRMNELVNILCPFHGKFEQRASEHLKYGCIKCGHENNSNKFRDNIEDFIKKAKQTHGNKYDYSQVVIDKPKNKVIILCPVHGSFKQNRAMHIQGNGCGKCVPENLSVLFTKGLRSFIEDAKTIHGNKYDYSEVKYYRNNKFKIPIICKMHGIFMQSPSKHINRKDGCPKCGGTSKLSTIEFVKKAIAIHGKKYDYSKSVYVTNKCNVVIICAKHGEFSQTPNGHLLGYGCSKCSESKGECKIREWLEFKGIKHKTQKRIKSGSRFDFVILRNNSPVVIEYHGKQHYVPSSFGSKKLSDKEMFLSVVRLDTRKHNWCKKNKIPLYVIPFWEYERIPDIMDAIVLNIDPCISQPPSSIDNYKELRNNFMCKIHDEDIVKNW